MVDDDEVARYLLRRTLATLTTTPIQEATTGAEALAAIAQGTPCLVFLDLLLPGLGGFEIARNLRADPRTRSIPIVLYTAKTLTPDELATAGGLDLTLISKRETGHDDHGEQRAHIERALLEVGLSNKHEGHRSA